MIEHYYIIVFIVPALLVLLITPGVIRYAALVGAIDTPNQRKIHQHPTPRLGGVSICISYLASLFIFLQVGIISNITTTIVSYQWISFIAALVIIFFVGVADDVHPLNPGKKFLVQAIAATIVYAGGFKISTMTSLLSAGTIDIGMLDYPLTLLWIVGITNAFNLIDGLDGLATGVGIIAAGSMFVISASNGHYNSALVILALVGSLG
ncbi:MAG: undecaprenyl/decaprenyl-phosphate alpha-N-acetylglucosaminyl 1-phosphate transferase [Ignavibacteriales bacterium]|nr:undecaprenyl/decaprenyl-phosphate alpha-N-acetylglucosaminyl 1-phosphate transferase [Ignavibacteriales bacterium]